MKLVIIYLLIAVTFFHKSYESRITVEEKYGVGNSLTILNNENRGLNCTGIVGSICSDKSEDCGSVVMCFPAMTPIVVHCPEGQTCNGGKCSMNKTTLCAYKKLTFKCTTEGIYSDPSSCKKYNHCLPTTSPETPVNPIPVSRTCPTGWGYDTFSTRCNRKLRDNNCKDSDIVVPQCKENGQSGPLKSDSAYYYTERNVFK